MLSKLPSCVCALPRALSHALASTSAAHSPTSSGLGGGVAQHTSPAWRGWVQARGLSAAQAINYANDSNQKLVDSLKAQGLLKSERCEAVMRQIDRRDFTTTHLGIPAHVSYSVRLIASLPTYGVSCELLLSIVAMYLHTCHGRQ